MFMYLLDQKIRAESNCAVRDMMCVSCCLTWIPLQLLTHETNNIGVMSPVQIDMQL